MATLADMIGVYVLSEAEVQGAMGMSGNRGINVLNTLAPYETSPNTVPVAIAEWAGTYTLDTAAKVSTVLDFLGPRGHHIFDYLISVKAA